MKFYYILDNVFYIENFIKFFCEDIVNVINIIEL